MSRPPNRTDRARQSRAGSDAGTTARHASAVSIAAGWTQWRTFGYFLLVMAGLSVLGGLTLWLRPLEVLDAFTHARLAYEGFHNETATVRGQRLHYYEGGSGRPILLIHGLGSRAEDWANLMPLLKRAGFHVYALDLLGYGSSARPANASYSIAEEAGYVEGFLTAQGLEHVAVAGWSMGGWVAMQVALDQPQRVERLILCDAAGIRFSPDFQVADFEPTTVDAVRRLYRLLMPRPQEIPQFLAAAMLRRFQAINWVVDRSTRSMFRGADLMDGRLGALQMPTLIVWGRQDHLIPLATGVALHQQIAQSALEIYDGCGHLAPGQCAGRLGPRMIDFLDGKGPAAKQTVEVIQQ